MKLITKCPHCRMDLPDEQRYIQIFAPDDVELRVYNDKIMEILMRDKVERVIRLPDELYELIVDAIKNKPNISGTFNGIWIPDGTIRY